MVQSIAELLKQQHRVAIKPKYYKEKYGTWQYGLNKLYLLMEKQHNRGQEGAGVGVVKMDSAPLAKATSHHRHEVPICLYDSGF